MPTFWSWIVTNDAQFSRADDNVVFCIATAVLMSPTQTESEISVRPHRARTAFSLVELLVVVAVLALVLSFVVPAVLRSRGGQGMKPAAYELAGLLQGARAYAMANNTYVWVGLYEENADSPAPTAQVPPYAGSGRVIASVVASIDGTAITTSGSVPTTLPQNRIAPLNPVTTLQNVHLSSLPAPTGGADGSFSGRPIAGPGAPLGLNSDSAEKATPPFTFGNYTFHKTIRFNPRGEAMINGTGDLRPVVEIGLRPTHGGQVDTRSTDLAAIQISGIAGNVTIYQP